LRLPRTEISEDELVNQIISEKTFSEKIREIEKSLLEYLIWFEICPISIGLQNIAKVEWDRNNDDKNAVRIIARLAMLLARLRGNVFVTKSSNTEDFIPSSLNNNNKKEYNNTTTNYHATEFIHGLPTIENPSRANQQLYNLARGHALSFGKNYITMIDIPLIIKVVLSTGSIERVLILDLLIANNGTLTTSQITTSMNISNSTAKRTMTEFKGLELVSMEKTDPHKSNSEYKITLNSKFDWFLKEEFKTLRDNFEPTDNQEFLKPKSNNDNDDSAAIKKPPVLGDLKQEESSKSNNREIINIIDAHRGENARSTFEEKQSKYLFNNSLISAEDLKDPNGFQYEPEVINNIDRYANSDHWYCKKKDCKIRGDKWLLMRHNCNYKNNNDKKEEY
jgi:predicted transcriptional regulator